MTREDALGLLNSLIVMNQEIKRRETYYGGRDVDVKAPVQAAKDDFKANHKRTLLTKLSLYLKPEESTLYYVANGSVEGKVKF